MSKVGLFVLEQLSAIAAESELQLLVITDQDGKRCAILGEMTDSVASRLMRSGFKAVTMNTIKTESAGRIYRDGIDAGHLECKGGASDG